MIIAQITDFHVRPRGVPRLWRHRHQCDAAARRRGHRRARSRSPIASSRPAISPIAGSPTNIARSSRLPRGAADARVRHPRQSRPARRDASVARAPPSAICRSDPAFLHYVVDDFPVRLIALDTVMPGEHGGDALRRARSVARVTRSRRAAARPTIVLHAPSAVRRPAWRRWTTDLPDRRRRSPALIARTIRKSSGSLCGHYHRPIVRCALPARSALSRRARRTRWRSTCARASRRA